jgi:hypothetical protein
MSVTITDHARLRYLQRFGKLTSEKIAVLQGQTDHEKILTLQRFDIIDLRQLDDEILGDNPQRTRKHLETLGSCIYPVGSHFLRVVNGTVVTVLKDYKSVGAFLARARKRKKIDVKA